MFLTKDLFGKYKFLLFLYQKATEFHHPQCEVI